MEGVGAKWLRPSEAESGEVKCFGVMLGQEVAVVALPPSIHV